MALANYYIIQRIAVHSIDQWNNVDWIKVHALNDVREEDEIDFEPNKKNNSDAKRRSWACVEKGQHVTSRRDKKIQNQQRRRL